MAALASGSVLLARECACHSSRSDRRADRLPALHATPPDAEREQVVDVDLLLAAWGDQTVGVLAV